MKIWNGYGSEHSMNLVMIGHFQSSEDAEKTNELIRKLTEALSEHIDVSNDSTRYSDKVQEILTAEKVFGLNPGELENFLYDVWIKVKGSDLILTTDETEVSAFFKLMVNSGAKVEIYSAHDYPDEEYGRGK